MERQKENSLKRQKNTEDQQAKQKHQVCLKKVKQNQKLAETRQKIQKIGRNDNQDLNCLICTSFYNLNRKLPVIACQNNHTFCLHCIILSVQATKPNCPICRQIIDVKQRNDYLYQKILNIYQNKNFQVDKMIMDSTFTKINVGKFAKKFSKLTDFQIIPRSGKIIKKQANNKQSILIFDPQLKDNSRHCLKFSYVPAGKQILLSFGVCAYDKFLCRVIDNCGFDTQIINCFLKKEAKNHQQKQKKGINIVAHVDLQKKQIYWLQQRLDNQKQSMKCQTKLHLLSQQPIEINGKVGDLSYYFYCVLYTCGDIIETNK